MATHLCLIVEQLQCDFKFLWSKVDGLKALYVKQ